MEQNKTKKAKSVRKQRQKILTWGGTLLLVLILAVLPVLAANKDSDQEQQASILSGTVEYGSIETKIVGGGQLASEAAVKLEIPEEVKLTEYLVGNGDTVSEGDAIAKVDRISVMTAITGVQDTLDELSGEILDAEDDQAATAVKAKVGGTVKVIYAQVGESAQDVMLAHGALAAISLDDVMAVQIHRESELDTGDPVSVSFPDGTETDGRVEQNLEGVLTITMDDDDYAVGAEVTVLTEDGDRLGKGNLYIFNQWNATAYSGTVSGILVKEGSKMYTGQEMIRLDDPGHTSEFQRLIDKRQEYEELMQELFRMYRTETIVAPCDGIVSGVDKDGVFLLADNSDGFVVNLLINLVSGRRNLFEAYGVRVEAVSGDGMQMQVNGKRSWVEDLSDLSAIFVNPEKMTQPWNYTGDTTVYVQDEDGLLRADGTAKPGDILLAVGDAESVRWFVRVNGTGGSESGAENGYGVSLLSSPAPQIDLNIDNTSGVAGYAFSGNLTATSKQGAWSITGESYGFVIYQNMLYHAEPKAGTYPITVTYQYGEGENDKASETFEITINPPYTILTESLPDGVKGAPYSGATLEVSGTGGQWMGQNMAGLVIDPNTGVISGAPIMSGNFTVTITYTYPKNEQKKEYITVEKELTLKIGEEQSGQQGDFPGGDMSGGMGGMPSGGMSGGMPSGGKSGSMPAGSMVQEEDSYYSMEKLTIASVTSQEHMTVEITIDELDISKVYIGQSATVAMDALAGESFAATVTKIANSGENEGGNSKFTVELTLEKSGDMLPGMTASAVIVLNTVEDALCIPAAALSEENGKLIVYTSYDSENEILGTPVEITIGAADADTVQILSDLEEGSTFYYAYYDTLESERKPFMGARPFG